MNRAAAAALLTVLSVLLFGVSIGWRLARLWPEVALSFPLFLLGIGVLIWAVALSMKGRKP